MVYTTVESRVLLNRGEEQNTKAEIITKQTVKSIYCVIFIALGHHGTSLSPGEEFVPFTNPPVIRHGLQPTSSSVLCKPGSRTEILKFLTQLSSGILTTSEGEAETRRVMKSMIVIIKFNVS